MQASVPWEPGSGNTAPVCKNCKYQDLHLSFFCIMYCKLKCLIQSVIFFEKLREEYECTCDNGQENYNFVKRVKLQWYETFQELGSLWISTDKLWCDHPNFTILDNT